MRNNRSMTSRRNLYYGSDNLGDKKLVIFGYFIQTKLKTHFFVYVFHLLMLLLPLLDFSVLSPEFANL